MNSASYFHGSLMCGVVYMQYEGGEACSICGHQLSTAEASQRSSAYPSTILPQFLYLGSYDNASRSELLKALGITHILNVCTPFLGLCCACMLLSFMYVGSGLMLCLSADRRCHRVSRSIKTPSHITQSAAHRQTSRSALSS
jgi:hypothetical protein